MIKKIVDNFPEPLAPIFWAAFVVTVVFLLIIGIVYITIAYQDKTYISFSEKIIYIKDHRVGICYASHEDMLATVPCDKVQKHLLNP